MEAANRYAQLAVQHLALVGLQREEDLYEAMGSMMAHLLFPNLSESERLMVEHLGLARRSLQLSVNIPRGQLSQERFEVIQDNIQSREQLFMEFKAWVESNVAHKLTPVQRELLEARYLHVGFRE